MARFRRARAAARSFGGRARSAAKTYRSRSRGGSPGGVGGTLQRGLNGGIAAGASHFGQQWLGPWGSPAGLAAADFLMGDPIAGWMAGYQAGSLLLNGVGFGGGGQSQNGGTMPSKGGKRMIGR